VSSLFENIEGWNRDFVVVVGSHSELRRTNFDTIHVYHDSYIILLSRPPEADGGRSALR
jgi:hypothetical protein